MSSRSGRSVDEEADATPMTGAIRQDVESALRFVHRMSMQAKIDLVDTTVQVSALVEELVSAGVLDRASYERRRQSVGEREDERLTTQGHAQVAVAPAQDKYALTDLPQVDCESRRPICQGRCCQFTFPLSFQDLDERKIAWDYGRPYHIRQCPDTGLCVHSSKETGACTVYSHRPAICRTYTCATDKRIWADFEARTLAPWPPGASPTPDTEEAPAQSDPP